MTTKTTAPRKRTPSTVLAYLRVSSTGQLAGDGMERQRQAIQTFADAKRWKVSEWHEDSISGRSEFEARDGLSSLLASVRGALRPVIVVVESADRIARDLIQSEVILGEFRKLNAEVFDSRGNCLTCDGENPSNKLIRQVLGAVAEFERSNLVNKLRAARVRKAEAGGWANGVRPYGALKGEEETLGLIFKLRTSKHMGYREIARHLNDEGIETRSGKQWQGQTVKNVVERGRKRAELARSD